MRRAKPAVSSPGEETEEQNLPKAFFLHRHPKIPQGAAPVHLGRREKSRTSQSLFLTQTPPNITQGAASAHLEGGERSRTSPKNFPHTETQTSHKEQPLLTWQPGVCCARSFDEPRDKNPPNSTKPKYQSSPVRIDGITGPSSASAPQANNPAVIK